MWFSSAQILIISLKLYGWFLLVVNKMSICIASSDSDWFQLCLNDEKNSPHTVQHGALNIIDTTQSIHWMNCSCLILPCDDQHSYEMNLFRCGNLLVQDQNDYGVGMLFDLWMMVQCFLCHQLRWCRWMLCFYCFMTISSREELL